MKTVLLTLDVVCKRRLTWSILLEFVWRFYLASRTGNYRPGSCYDRWRDSRRGRPVWNSSK